MLSKVRSSVHRNLGQVVRTLVLCGLLSGALAQSAAGQVTFAGEVFVGDGPPISTNCAADGSGSLTYSVAGTAGAPVVGSFTESGSVLLGPLQGPTSPVLAFDAHFEVRSNPGGVLLAEGDKRLIRPQSQPSPSTGFGRCGAPFPQMFLAPTEVCYSVNFPATGVTERGLTQVDLAPLGSGMAHLVELFTGPDATGTCTELFCDKFKDKPGTDKDKCKAKKEKG